MGKRGDSRAGWLFDATLKEADSTLVHADNICEFCLLQSGVSSGDFQTFGIELRRDLACCVWGFW